MKKSSLSLLAILAGTPVIAEEVELQQQEAEPQEAMEEQSALDTADEEVVAVGYMFQGEQATREEQRNSKSIMNVISADGIGKLPDRNAAEAVQRIPGVSIERDQGEGRFVAVRGLPSQWNSTSVNGNRLPGAEEETTTRATAFDFLPTEMIQAVRVSKAVTADMEGDAIGGAVDFETKKAPEETVLDVTLGANYNDRAEGAGYNANFLFGGRMLDNKLGAMINYTTWERDWATDNFEPRRTDFIPDGETEEISGIKRLELRDYTGTRETTGMNVALDYNFDNGDMVYANYMQGKLEDEEIHYKHRYRTDKEYDHDDNAATPDLQGRVELQHIYNILITEMQGTEFGGEHFLNNGDTKMDWSLSSYESEFRYGDIPNAEDKSYFVMRFDQTAVGFEGLVNDADGNGYIVNEVDGGTDPADAVSTHLPDGFEHDPTQMGLSWVELYKVAIKDKDKAIAKLDFTHVLDSGTELKFGAKYRNKERTARFADEFYEWDEETYGPAPTLSDFDLKDQPGRDDFLPEVDVDYAADFSQVADVKDVANFWNENKDKFVLVEDESALISNGGALSRNIDVKETQSAVYGMATMEMSDELTLIAGMRLEQTDTEISGYELVKTSENDPGTVNRVVSNNDYLSVLPNLHAKYLINDESHLRAAVTRTFARPDFGDLAPGGSYSEHDTKFYGGNPDLDPTYSLNYDLMYDYYFGDVGVISAGVFYKDITDPIYQAASTITYRGQAGVEATRPENGDDAWLMGAEFTFASRLDVLHDSLYHFGVNANLTVLDSEMKTEDGRKVSIPRQADSLYNLAFFYDDSIWAARIAMNYKGEYITEHGGDADHDEYYGEYTSLDFSGSYKPMDNLMVYLELNNLNNEALTYYQGTPDRPNQVEYYGMRSTLGVKYSFF